jgi:hypothetical protein
MCERELPVDLLLGRCAFGRAKNISPSTRASTHVAPSSCRPERGARESKDPGAVSSAIAASRRSPQTVSVELPVAAWSQPASSGFFDCAVRLRSGSAQNDRLVEGIEIPRPVDSDLSKGMNTAPFRFAHPGLKAQGFHFFGFPLFACRFHTN